MYKKDVSRIIGRKNIESGKKIKMERQNFHLKKELHTIKN